MPLQSPPHGMDAMIPAFNRATRLAKALFGSLDACVVLIDNQRAWRSRARDNLPDRDMVAEYVIETGEPLWLEDAATDPRVTENPGLNGVINFRFYAAAPIVLADGLIAGVVCVVDAEPRAYDAKLLPRLCDLADGLADDCEHGRLVKQADESAAAAEKSAVAAEAANETLSSLVRHVPMGLVMTDRDMVILKANARWAGFQGKTEADVVGRSLYEAAPFTQNHKALHAEVLAGTLKSTPRLRVKIGGSERALKIEFIPWRRPDGEVGGMMVATSDITDMVEALDRSERSEQRLQMALDLADMHVWEMDYKRGVLEKAGNAEAFFDVPFSYEDVAANIMCAIHPDDRAMVVEILSQPGVARDTPVICRTKRSDGKEVWAANASRVFRDENGKTERIVGMFHNLTSIKLAEQSLIEARDAAEAANRSKSEFLANMSHEIRTPLNGVLGMAQVIEADELSDVQRERIKVVRESGGALLAILNDVLDLSKIQAGKLELDVTDFDMADLAPVVTAAFDGVAAAKDVALTVAIDDSAAGAWKGDILRLRQVASNLVSNALKFTAEGEVALTVRHDGKHLIMAVRDSGIGIDSDKIAGLFDKFSQEDASTTRRYGGTGLGLSICRELVELMGGRIEVESRKGEGSCFSVILPMERGVATARPTPKASRPTPSAEEAGAAPVRILAAEDNVTNQLVLRSLLAPLGVELTLANNGVEAVEAFKTGQFDVVLMDVQMPEMNGVEATRIIRDWEKEHGRIRTPILSLTANVMLYQLDEYRAAGMDGAIAKPIEVEKLYAALDEALTAAEEARAAA